jgi:threonine aldolase
MLVGSRDFIHRAHRMRKVLGGGMRQAGILAAAGIIALEQMVDRLAEDHETCKQLAYGLAEYPQIDINVDRVATNMVLFSVRNAQLEPLSEAETMQFLEKAGDHGVVMGHIGQGKIRAVTHFGIDSDAITTALNGIRRTLIDLQL